MKKCIVFILEYLFIFLGFVLMFFFIIPNSDVFFFTKDYDNSISLLIDSSLKYGNGRFLGNLIGFFFAHKFLYAFILIALSLTALAFFINKFFFNGNAYTAFPIALFIAIPSTEMVSEVYYQVPTTINYVIPMLLVFISLCLIKATEYSIKSHLYGVLIFFTAVFSCLFSENNTISIFTLSVLCIIFYALYRKEKIVPSVYFLAGSIVGGLIMLFLPRLTNSSGKLDFYRGTAKSLTSMITLAIASFSTFADIFSKFCVPIIITSSCFIILINKNIKKSGLLNKVIIFYLIFFAVESVLYTLLSQNAPATIYLYIPQLVLVIIYALSLFAAILMLKKNQYRTVLIGLFILMLSTVGPMLFVDKYGCRTFYLSYVVFFAISMSLLRYTIPSIKNYFKDRTLKEKSKKMFALVSGVVFASISVIVFFQSVYNFNFYAIRTQFIASQSAQGAEEICVPLLPCRSISLEEENPTLVGTILYKKGSSANIKITNSINCENTEEYYNILNTNPISNIFIAVNNIKYKDPLYFNEILENHQGVDKTKK